MENSQVKTKNLPVGKAGLPAEIGEFYDALIEKVANLRLEAREKIKSVQKEQEELSNKLQESLSKGEHLRKADFRKLMGEIIIKRKEREKEVMEMLAQFQKEEEEMAQGLKRLFANGQQVRLRDFKNFIAEFKKRAEARKGEVEEIFKASTAIRKSAVETITQFRQEREEMIKEWKKLTEKMQAKRAQVKEARERRRNG